MFNNFVKQTKNDNLIVKQTKNLDIDLHQRRQFYSQSLPKYRLIDMLQHLGISI